MTWYIDTIRHAEIDNNFRVELASSENLGMYTLIIGGVALRQAYNLLNYSNEDIADGFVNMLWPWEAAASTFPRLPRENETAVSEWYYPPIEVTDEVPPPPRARGLQPTNRDGLFNVCNSCAVKGNKEFQTVCSKHYTCRDHHEGTKCEWTLSTRQARGVRESMLNRATTTIDDTTWEIAVDTDSVPARLP